MFLGVFKQKSKRAAVIFEIGTLKFLQMQSFDQNNNNKNPTLHEKGKLSDATLKIYFYIRIRIPEFVKKQSFVQN